MLVFEQLERNRSWDESESLIVSQVDRLCADVIAPNAAHIDATGEFPWKNIEAINALGLNTIFIPEQFGGTGMSFRLYLAVVRRIAEACASTGIIYATNFHAMKPLIEFGTDEQRERLLPCIAEGGLASLAITEEAAGSDATGMKTRFTEDGDDMRLRAARLSPIVGRVRLTTEPSMHKSNWRNVTAIAFTNNNLRNLHERSNFGNRRRRIDGQRYRAGSRNGRP